MSLNIDLFYLINNSLSNTVFDVIMPPLSNFGGFAFLAVFCLAGLIVTYKNIFNLRKYYGLLKLCAVSLIITTAIVFCLKITFSQPRPYLVLDHVNILATSVDPNSFPSGHTSSTLSIITVLVVKSRDYFEKYNILNCLFVVFAALIAVSRVYVGLHYPFDVMVGGFIGMVVGVVVCRNLKV